MELRELRTFVAVVEEGGLSAGARRLHVSQSALSQTVRGLERQLGVPLLIRDHTGVQTTDAGALLVREARALLEQHDHALARVRSAGGIAERATAGVLTVGAPLEIPADLLPTALRRLGATFPDTTVTVRHSSSIVQLDDLRSRELDVALVRDRPADPALDSVLSVLEPMGVILSTAGAELIAGDGVHLERLAGLDWTGFARSESPAWHDLVTATLRAHGIEVPTRLATSDRPTTPEVKLATVGTGRAFALASEGWAHPLPQGMQWFPLVGTPIVRRTWAVWHGSARQLDLAALIAELDLSNR